MSVTAAGTTPYTYQPAVQRSEPGEPAEAGTTGGPDGAEPGAGASGDAARGAKEGARSGRGAGAERGARDGADQLNEHGPSAAVEPQTSIDVGERDVEVKVGPNVPSDAPIPTITDLDYNTTSNWVQKQLEGSLAIQTPSGVTARADAKEGLLGEIDGKEELTFTIEADGWEYEYEAKFDNGGSIGAFGEFKPSEITLVSAKRA